MLFVSTCGGCGAYGPSPCAGCIDSLVAIDVVTVPGVDQCQVLFDYDDLSRRFVTQLKYRGVRSAVGWMSLAMAQRASTGGLAPFDVVTWVPATPANRRRRGFDQSEILARRLARRLRVPARRVLVRGSGPSQTGLTRAERMVGPALASRRPISGKVLLVDDVVTTGASMAVAATELRRSGASHVGGMVVAHRSFR